MKMKILYLLFAGMLLFPSVLSTAENMERLQSEQTSNILSTTNLPYEGHLRIYIVEPESRWNNYDGEPYHYGFLDFAYNDGLSIAYQDTYEDTIAWDPVQEGFSDVSEDNIMVVAAIFNPEIKIGYSEPPFQGDFETHYVDAATGVKPGETNSNVVQENFTHTVFVEEGTATWCPYCPAMANTLNDIYLNGELPFYFVALIEDKSDIASHRVRDELNIAGFPTAWFDGAYQTLLGGSTNTNSYETKIQRSGIRDVHELDLTMSCEWTQDNKIVIDISITNNEELFNSAPDIPSIVGPSSGKANEEQTYEITGTDPDGNEIFIIIDWGDGTEETMMGPYSSGKTLVASHTWEQTGDYTIRARTRDTYDELSEWATLAVSMPRSKPTIIADTTLEIAGIRGGIGSIICDIKNIGDEIAEKIQSTIVVKGGILDGVDLVHICSGCDACGTTLAPDSIKTENTIEAGFILGFGSIEVTAEAWAENANKVTETTTGFVFGPLVII